MNNVKELRKIGDQFPHLFYIAAGNGKCWKEDSFDTLMAPLLTELSNGRHLVYNGVPIYTKMQRAVNMKLEEGTDPWHFSADYENKKIFFTKVFSLICLSNFYKNVMVDDKNWDNLRKDGQEAQSLL